MATPALRGLRAVFPEAEITLGLKPYVAPLLEGWAPIDRLMLLPAKGLARVTAMRREGFDLAVLLTNSFGSAIESRLAGIGRRLGYRGDGRAWLLTDRPRRPRDAAGGYRPTPMVRLYLDLVATLGEVGDDEHYELPVSDPDEAHVRAWLEAQGWCEGQPLIGLNPGARFGASKLWRADRFAAVGQALEERSGARCVVLAGPGEEPLRDAISQAMGRPPLGAGAELLPLGPLKALIRRLALLVTTDSGPRAIAQAFDVPSVVVMGPTHPGWTDAQRAHSVIVRHDVPCGPCHLPRCPTDHACMERITVSEVLQAVQGLSPRF